MLQATARARYVRTSPRKARLVIDAIRGKDVKEALAILKFTPNYAARLIEKVVASAAANAENNHRMDGDNLRIAVATVDGGPNVMKRLRHAPMGRGYRIVKRMSHITIVVEETEPKADKKAPKKRGAVARPARAPKAVEKPAEAEQPAAQQEAPEPKKTRRKKSDGETEAKGGE